MFEKNMDTIKKIFDAGFQKNAVFNYKLAGLTSLGTGGDCLFFLKIESRDSLIETVKKLKENSIEFFIVGGGTNILFNDGSLDFAVLKLGKEFNYLNFTDSGEIIVGAAFKMQKFVIECAKKGYDFSFLAGIPGTIGGAVMGNSGRADEAIDDYLKKIRYLAVNKDEVEDRLCGGKSSYGYRDFHINDLLVLTDVILAGRRGDRELIFNKIRENIKIKKAGQPLTTKNAGCFFKNIEGFHLGAGEMIDKCGLKNFSYGGARVSVRHANFLENHSNATSKDLLILSKIIKYFIRKSFNKELEQEIRMVGF